MERIANLINGEFSAPESGQYLDNVEPATGRVYSWVPDSDGRDVARAVEAAQRAFPAWRALSHDARSRLLWKLADRIEAELDSLARDESTDNGKPVSVARTVDIPRASANFRFFSQALSQFASEAHAAPPEMVNYTTRDPIGVVGCISPWNLPLYLFTWKIAPALAAGNTVVAKPSEVTPLTAYRLARLVNEVGFPPGVLNIVHGLGPKVGAALVEHPAVKAISFTGGTKTGAEIARVAAPQFKKLSLELGGKNPTIILDDAEPEEAINGALRAAFSNQGQICLCGSRILIARPLYARVRDALVARANALTLGDPQDPSTQQGALVSAAHLDKVLSYVALARQEGGTVLCGGERVTVPGRCQEGYFLRPTLIEGLPASCRTNQEEIFGPVATLLPFDSDEEAVALANSTPYGLSASVWGGDTRRCHRVAHALDAGIVWVNTWMLRDLRTPFGGVKQSGVGREGGFEALRFFTEPKNICIKL